ncbi:MAG: hypothetical protein WKF94_18590 [Solirubrobacteraceae bacterium]
MALADRTFSFRAPAQLAERLRDAERAYRQLARDPAAAARVTRDLEIELLRRLRREPDVAAVQGQVLRAVAEAFVGAIERAVDEPRQIDQLRAFDRLDMDGDAERRALLRASTLLHDDA